MKNFVADRNNIKPSNVGLFIFASLGLNFGGLWMHVDIAAHADSGERATAASPDTHESGR